MKYFFKNLNISNFTTNKVTLMVSIKPFKDTFKGLIKPNFIN